MDFFFASFFFSYFINFYCENVIFLISSMRQIILHRNNNFFSDILLGVKLKIENHLTRGSFNIGFILQLINQLEAGV